MGDDKKRIGLVDTPDHRTDLERCAVTPERLERNNKIAKLTKQVRDAVDALDTEELAEFVEYQNLTQQEIKEVCMRLRQDTRLRQHLNSKTERFLRTLKPNRLWGLR